MKRSFRLPVVVTTLVVMGVILNIDGEDEEISMFDFLFSLSTYVQYS